MLALFETPAGFALFKVLNEGKLDASEELYKEFESPELARKMVKLKAFDKFENTTDALDAASQLVDSKLPKGLRKFLKAQCQGETLAIADSNLGKAISDELEIHCVNNAAVSELMRGLRSQLSELISGLTGHDTAPMSLGLSHCLSRYKLQFSHDKVDTIIMQATGLSYRPPRILQTSLGCGKDLGQEESCLPCHLLELDGSCVLLECPIDLSALTLFHPVPHPEEDSGSARSFITVRKRKGNRDTSLRPFARIRLSHEEDGKGRDCKESSSLVKELNGQVLAKGEPWYKVSGLELVDVGLLDAVLISNPAGMLGLPFLTKHPDFCGKVYATKATAEIGRMMMEELVLLHADFVQHRGRPETLGEKPPWLDPSFLHTLPVHMRGSSLGRCFSNRANWQPLYSVEDIRDCFVHVQKLRFCEEVNVNGSLRLSPSSSGMGIGTSNWVISGASQSVGYVAASLERTNHAMPLDVAPLTGCHTLLISDVECSPQGEMVTSSREDHVAKAQEIPELGGPARQSSSGFGVSQRPTLKTSGSLASAPARGSLPSSIVGAPKPSTVFQPLIEEAGKGESAGVDVATLDLAPEVASACKRAIEALRRGGSVLFPISPCGLLLELLEELGVQLGAANLKHVPVHYISSAAEEMLAYCNTVPEWLCRTRQEKLYAGESLFGYVNLLQEERLHHLKALSSPELKKVLQEPCVVFAAHFSLRMGPAAHLLHCWRQNPLCLLILTEGKLDKDLLLAPYMPLSMQVLDLPVSLRLRSKKVATVLQSVRPQVALVPEFSRRSLEAAGSHTKVVLGYSVGRSVQVPNFETELEVNMCAELALQVEPKLVKPKTVAAAPFRADLCFRDGKLSLRAPASSSRLSSDVYQFRWGPVSVGALSKALQERGMGDVSVHESGVEEASVVDEASAAVGAHLSFVVEIRSPSRAWIELGPNRSHIKADEPSLRRLIADAINSVLQVM